MCVCVCKSRRRQHKISRQSDKASECLIRIHRPVMNGEWSAWRDRPGFSECVSVCTHIASGRFVGPVVFWLQGWQMDDGPSFNTSSLPFSSSYHSERNVFFFFVLSYFRLDPGPKGINGQPKHQEFDLRSARRCRYITTAAHITLSRYLKELSV